MVVSGAVMVAAGVGVLGGAVRALYGLLKASAKGFDVNKGYFFMTLLISAFIGGLLGLLFDTDFRIAALAGYVGTDILENIFKETLGGKLIASKK